MSEVIDYSKMLKADLIALCEERSLDTSGTVAVLIARLEANDNPEPARKAKPKKKKFNSMSFRFQ